MTKHKRDITIKVIEVEKEYKETLIEFLAKKYSEKGTKQKS